MGKAVREIIKERKEVYCVSNQATVAEAARYLKERRTRAAGVCNLTGKIVGIVSQSDISDKVVAENYRPSDVKVQSILTEKIIKITPDTECGAAIEKMRENGIYHLAVEDSDGTFLGMISLRDCMQMIAQQEHERAEMYENYVFPRY